MDGRILKHKGFEMEGLNSFIINNNLIGYSYFEGNISIKYLKSHNMLYLTCEYEYFPILNTEYLDDNLLKGKSKGYCFIK